MSLHLSEDGLLVVNATVYGQDITVYCSQPTTNQQVEYNRKGFHVQGRKTELRQFEVAIKIGRQVVQDVREGDLVIGNQVITNKVEGWKDIIQRTVPQLFASAAVAVMHSEAEIANKKDDEEPGQD